MRARRRAWWIGAAALSAATVLAAPTSALATGTYAWGPRYVTYATVRGTHGFKVRFAAGNRGVLKLRVGSEGSTTSYEARARSVARGRVFGNLGGRGRFDLRFVPVGKPERLTIPQWCTGPHDASWQRGYLVGHYRFRGERNYTQVRGHRVPAALESWPRLRCHFRKGRFHPLRQPRSSVGAWWHQVRFGASLFHRHARPPGCRVAFRAAVTERRGDMTIHREAKVAASERAVAFPGGPKLPEEIEVTPPAPFTGSATFTRTPESTFSWIGDLAVDFPGIAPVRLAGPRFAARMCAREACLRQEPGREGTGIEFDRPDRSR